MTFQIHALSPDPFKPLFALTNEELKQTRASRLIVDTKHTHPCRVSLADAEIGETVILTNFTHQPAESPYQATHAIFVREHAEQAFPEVGVVPEAIQTRLISIRAFDNKHHLIDADVVDGSYLNTAIPATFENPKVVYMHLHNARPGCFAARVSRA